MDVTLQTDRLLLRMFREEDLAAYAQICADPEVMRFLGNGNVLDRAQTWGQIAWFLGHWALRGYGMWAVEERATGELVGRIGFIDPEGWPGFELGWTLRRSSWGMGFATEGAKRALQYAFEALGRDRVISLVRPLNAPSIKVAERIGERLEGEVELFGSKALVYAAGRNPG
ncbi:MAG TPA: GNAT family N-acetyltransferase [Ramlibacter sp.]|nr:GNAT family N-acetyltransferase [Ramlibacter sp.]